MKIVTATDAKQKFGELIRHAVEEDVAIHRHGQTIAIITAPDRGREPLANAERRIARLQQNEVEKERLIKHQRIAIRMLQSPDQARYLLEEARQSVQRWEAEGLCSRHFISGWTQLLDLPVPRLAEEMCSDLNGWGKALRQNSPWSHS